MAAAKSTEQALPYWPRGMPAALNLLYLQNTPSPSEQDQINIRFHPSSTDTETSTPRISAPLGTLPAGWPSFTTGPLLWSASDYEDESSYVISLTQPQLREIDRALAIVQGA